jgi:hypothetical protein
MPSEPYVTVTLRKDIVKKLGKTNPSKATSALVTEAIQEYIQNKTTSPVKMPEIDYPSLTTAV